MQAALWLSLKAAVLATAIALVLGSMAAFARPPLPLLRPRGGLVPVRAPDRAAGDHHRDGAELVLHLLEASTSALLTIVIGHATFCVVVVYNNVLARLRRVPGSLDEASMDLGADGWQTFRLRDAADDLDGARLRRRCSRSRSRSTR